MDVIWCIPCRHKDSKCNVCDDELHEDNNAGCCINKSSCNVNKMHTRCGEWNDDTQEWMSGDGGVHSCTMSYLREHGA